MIRVSVIIRTLKHLLYQLSTKLTVQNKTVDLQRFVRFGFYRVGKGCKVIFWVFTPVIEMTLPLLFRCE